MESPRSALAPLLLVVALYGCAATPTAPKMSVAFVTDPPNASLYATSGIVGPTPLTLHYDIPVNFTSCVELEELHVVWASGAWQAIELSACPGDAPERQFTIRRPAVPGRDVDLWYATRITDLGLLPADQGNGKNAAITAVASKR